MIHRIKEVSASLQGGVDKDLLAILNEYNSSLPASEKRNSHLELLQHSETQAVVTGQQVGLFLGPLFTLHKAASCIVAARQVEELTGRRTVPIFWLQTEDHDFEEIRSITIPFSNTTLSIGEDAESDSRRSVSTRILDENINRLKSELLEALSSNYEENFLAQLFTRHYLPKQSISRAFAGLLAEVFSEEGLVFLDPNVAGIKKLAVDIFTTSINEHDKIHSLLRERNDELQNQGESIQVSIREHSPLAFFHEGDANGPRFRIERVEDAWRAIGGTLHLSDSDIKDILESNVERLSTSALLRPLFQDKLLPTVAYVAGNAEISYLKQISPLYPFFGIEEPARIPRNQFTLLEAKTIRLLETLSLSWSDFLLPKEKLDKRLFAKSAHGFLEPDELKKKANQYIQEAHNLLREEYGKLDSTLLVPVEKAFSKIDNAIESIQSKYSRALKENISTDENRISWLRAALAPEEVSQERAHPAAYYLANYGPQVKKKIIDACDINLKSMKGIPL